MKSKTSSRDIQRGKIAVMSLEERTQEFWKVSRAKYHPQAAPVSTEFAIALLTDIEEYTSLQHCLGHQASDLLDDIIGREKTPCCKSPQVEYRGSLEPPIEMHDFTAQANFGPPTSFYWDDDLPPSAA